MWNKKVNLTRITEPQDFMVKHFLDSVACFNWGEVQVAKTIIDIGTGAGFPGIPLAILFEEKKFILMDSTGKKINILSEIKNNLQLKNVELIHGRAEILAHENLYREKFDLCVSRAVAAMPVLCEFCLPFVKVGGYFFSYRGEKVKVEQRDSKKAIQVLGGGSSEIRSTELLSYGLNHSIIVVEKNKHTSKEYPRRAELIKNKPL